MRTERGSLKNPESQNDVQPQRQIENQFNVGLVCYENERPLRGPIAELDWLHRGWFTRWIRAGVLSGKKNEVCYLPYVAGENVFHFIVVGGGMNPNPEQHPPLTPEQQKLIQKTFDRLGMTNAWQTQ